MQFGVPYGIANRTGQISREEGSEMLAFAAANGFDTLDTAVGYGDSEERLGELGTETFKVVTKLPEVPSGCSDITAWAEREVRSSLARMRRSSHYGILLHRPQQLAGDHGEELYGALVRLKEKGLTRKIGISVYAPSELAELLPRYPVDLVQAPFNIVDRRLQTSGWLKKMHERGVEVHTRSTFLQGLLLFQRADIPGKFSPWSALWDVWHSWLERNGVGAVAACIAFVRRFPEVDRIVLGADSTAHLRETVSAASSVLAPSFPDIESEDERLLNPARWNEL